MPRFRDVHWFSCLDNIDQLQSLSLWQAVVYILKHVKDLPDEAYWPYIDELHKIEEDSANELLDECDTSGIESSKTSDGVTHLLVTDEAKPYLDDLVFTCTELDDHLDLLESNRRYLTEQFAIPDLLYTILSADIARATLGLPIKLQLQKKNIANRWPLIRRTSLAEWQRANTLDALQLQKAGKSYHNRQIKPDQTERLYLTIGLIGRLLADPGRQFRQRVAKGSISVDALSNLIHDLATADHIDCPSIRTLTSYFNHGERECINQTRDDRQP